MARLKFKNQYPPRGWQYMQPETHLKIEGENHTTLMKKVLEHRQYKGLARATLPEVILDVERQICSRLTARDCHPEGIPGEMRPADETQVLGVGTVLKFSRAAMSWLASGAKVVDVELMKKRQDTCLACPLNNPIKACNCTPFYRMIDALVPKARQNEGIFICSACSCSLNAKTQMPIEMVLQADEGRNISYAIGCWVTAEKT